MCLSGPTRLLYSTYAVIPSLYINNRLDTARHRRPFPRFRLKGGGGCTQTMIAVEWTTYLVEKEPEKIQACPGIGTWPSDDRAQSSIHLPYQANWRASHCEFVIYMYPMVDIRWLEIYETNNTNNKSGWSYESKYDHRSRIYNLSGWNEALKNVVSTADRRGADWRCSDVQERRPERKMWLHRAGSYVLSQARGRSPISWDCWER